MANGLFIVFEGPDGAGKSTLLKMIEKQLFSQYPKLTCVYTREPGGTNNKIAEDIRHILIEKDEYQIDAYAETLLFAASRSQHVKDFIIPNLKANNVILCDRYVHSSLVYQGIARGLGIDNVWEINKFAIHGVLPHLTVLLMIKPDQAYDRMMKNRLLNNH
jgi:dTMP kinase